MARIAAGIGMFGGRVDDGYGCLMKSDLVLAGMMRMKRKTTLSFF